MSARMQLAEWVLARIGDRAESEVRIVGGTSALTRFANSFIHQNVGEEGDTVSLRVAVDGRVASGTTSNTEPEALSRFVDQAIDRALLQPVDPDWPGLAEPAPVHSIEHYDEETAAADPVARAERVGSFVAAGGGMLAAGYCETTAAELVFANSIGVRHEGRYTAAVLDGIHQTATSAGSGHAASSRLAEIDPVAVGTLAARRAADSAEAHDVPPGEYEVVLAPECVATIGIFLGFYGFNAKLLIEGQSFAEIGEQQFDDHLTIVDDVTDPRAMGVGFDAEGTPRHAIELVERGMTRAVVHDRRTAAKSGVRSTGHAVPGSEVHGPYPSAMFVRPGDESLESLIGAVDRGIYVATFNYCRVLDPKSMAVTGLTRNGNFMIEQGAITGAISNMRFTQSFLNALGPGRVAGVGDDNRWADSEFGPGLVHAPSLRLAGWHFTGGSSG